MEGKFKKGMLDGYGRLIDAENGQVKVGFFKEEFLHGKGQLFTIGQDAADFEGLFEDDEGVKEQEVQTYTTKLIEKSTTTKALSKNLTKVK